MKAVWLGQQRFQAVGSGFESLSCQIFLRFTLSIFWCPKLVKQWRVPLRCFSALWDKKFPTEILDNTPLLFKFFRYRKFLKHSRKRFPCEIFRHCETKKIRRKIMTLPPSPPHSKINSFATGNFLKHSTEGFLYEMFRDCKTKKFRRKIVT